MSDLSKEDRWQGINRPSGYGAFRVGVFCANLSSASKNCSYVSLISYPFERATHESDYDSHNIPKSTFQFIHSLAL